LTADAEAIVSNLRGTLYKWQKPTLPLINDWVNRQKTSDIEHGINLVIRDYVDETFIKTVIDMNL
jgi:hypothetical protein